MPEKHPSIMRALGLVTGDLWGVLRGRPRKPVSEDRIHRETVRKETSERVVSTGSGEVVLRRTIIEEVEVRKPGGSGGGGG
jgi:hypothetical protein